MPHDPSRSSTGSARSTIRSERDRRRRAGSGRCRPPIRWRSRRKRSSCRGLPRQPARALGPGQAEALLRDRRAARAGARAAHAPVHAELPEEHGRRVAALALRCSTSSRRSSSRITRRSRPATRAPTTSAGARCCRGSSCASRTTRASTASYRLFRYGHWIPAQWREFHELYEFARMRGWQREQLVYGAGAFARPGVSFEQEYLKALLLMRLDSGNFTPDQVEWVARQLDDWTPSLTLVAAARRRRGVLRRPDRHAGPAPPRQAARPAAACCCSMPGPCTRASSSSCAGCPSRTSDVAQAR